MVKFDVGFRRGSRLGAGLFGLACLSGSAPITVGIHLEDDGVVNQAIDGGDGHRGVGEDLVPGTEGLVGGDHDRSSLVAGADELEQHRRLGLVLLEIGEIIKDDEVIFIELLDGAGEFEFLPCGLELLDQIGGAGEQDAIAGLDQGVPERCGQVAFAGARRSSFIMPAIMQATRFYATGFIRVLAKWLRLRAAIVTAMMLS